MNMIDGHTGLSNDVVKELSSKKFQAKLCYLKTDSENYFVVHIHSGIINISTNYQPSNFLQDLGFEECKNCQFFPSGCYYKVIYRIKNDFFSNDLGHMRETQFIHSEFENFMNNIDNIYDMTLEIKRKSSLFFRNYVAFKPISLKELEIKTPMWIDKYKSENFKQGFEKIEKIKQSLKQEITLLKLLTCNGKELEDAVRLAFEIIGFSVTKTKDGFTVDLLAEKDSLKLGLEVTGITNIIDKKSKKINQILAFQQDERFDDYKSLLIANVKMNEDPESRKKPYITNEALSLIESLNVGFIDTFSLFKVVKHIQEGNMSLDSFISSIKNKKGIINFEGE